MPKDQKSYSQTIAQKQNPRLGEQQARDVSRAREPKEVVTSPHFVLEDDGLGLKLWDAWSVRDQDLCLGA